MSAAQKPTLPLLHPIAGIRLGTACAGIKYPERRDLVIIALAEGTQAAAVFTQNAFAAAPVILARQHLAQVSPQYLLINTGNANAGTGAQGLADARACCQAVATPAGCAVEAVVPFSTGVIGEPLPVTVLTGAIPAALAVLSETGWAQAAEAILTTDTVPKGASRQIEIAGQTVTITGIAKGSGMIRPNMATLLAYIATDAMLPQPVLQACLQRAVAASFNRISVDGDTSTNDACLLLATGQAGVVIDDTASAAFETLCAAVTDVCEQLARALVVDGEGATKLINIVVDGGRDTAECLQVAYTIAHSPLVKTACFAGDPNWGRILAAVGRAGIADMNVEAINIYLDQVCIVRGGGRDPDYREADGQAVMDGDDITIRVELARGEACERIWSCDFSYDYIRINAEYRS